MELMSPAAPRVLFVCSADGNRSLLAAALLAHLAGPGLEVEWARSQTPCVHPFTLTVLNERGVNAEAPHACLYDAAPKPFDLLIHLGGLAEPLLAGPWQVHHTLCWTLTNPAQVQTGVPSLQAFRYIRDDLERRAWRLLQQVEPTASGV